MLIVRLYSTVQYKMYLKCYKTWPNIIGWRTICSTKKEIEKNINIASVNYTTDDWSNISPNILKYIGRNLHLQSNHPLFLMKKRIEDYFYKRFIGRRGNPMFSIYDDLCPVVSVHQNFDDLLVPIDHPCRKKSDCYYVNSEHILRSHMTAHQSQLIRMGLNNFLMIGDCYRRDEIDSTHYPVFHQVDAVRLIDDHELKKINKEDCMQIFENGSKTSYKQECHTLIATKYVEKELQETLVGLAQSLFGPAIPYRWVESYFPFTHPSWEMEIHYNDKWMELLGCGVMRHEILKEAGSRNQIGWAFGIGLERLAMCLYKIPDIRLFWSQDSGFLSQFDVEDPATTIVYKPVSIFPQCINDMSFWLPTDKTFQPNDFFDLVREVASDIVEQINLVDEFVHPKTKATSHCYRIIYRHMEKTLTNEEVNKIHTLIAENAIKYLGVKVR